ncbi:MerR family transcriptional regulator [Mycolicibacterium farcinogenes]|nr:MerR family transcriptional regulator [Mycolicibacterium farcinogenes]
MSGQLTIGEVSRRTGVAQTALRYYEQVGLLPAPDRVGGQRRYPESVLVRLEVIRLCKTAGFALDDIAMLMDDDTPGRPVARALAQAKLTEIDEQMSALTRARAIIEWGMRCTCPSIDACTCGIHNAIPV